MNVELEPEKNTSGGNEGLTDLKGGCEKKKGRPVFSKEGNLEELELEVGTARRSFSGK